jgi:NADH-quinone oxidoreductase subunit C
MKQDQIRDKLVSRFGNEVVLGSSESAGEITAFVVEDKLLDVCRFLRDDPELKFNFLSFVAGMDNHPGTPRFEVVYQLNSLVHFHRFRIKATVNEDADGTSTVDSVYGVWTTADWHERETAEMFGIVFRNHPDPRKLLLPDNWNGHPLRKDYPLMGLD